ncbi:mitochondrial carrier domain-containing [Cystoisospora suis]|uniref:Mitochondrial carrier domain-containing n=1 Tax=Cystoisospora suis TaxID=483139 RepID=A0A2C6KQ04_9APIC|nr:mitochondrial carrier domain-containing [Cystoisospora suis]
MFISLGSLPLPSVSSVSNGAIPTYASTAQTIKAIWRVEGHRGLWKGVTATAAASGLSWGIFRYLFDACRYKFASIPAFGDYIPRHASAPSSSHEFHLSFFNRISPSSWSSQGPKAGAGAATIVHSSSSPAVSDEDNIPRQSFSVTQCTREELVREVNKEDGEKNGGVRESRRFGKLSSVVSLEESDQKSVLSTQEDERVESVPFLWAQPELEEDAEGINSSVSFKANLFGKMSQLMDGHNVDEGVQGNSHCCEVQNQVNDRRGVRGAQAASLVAGLASTLLSHPLWLAKARMEMQAFETKGRTGWPHYRNPLDCLLRVGRQGGLRALYAGLGPAIMLVPHAAVQIIVYEDLKKRESERHIRQAKIRWSGDAEQKAASLSSSPGGFGVKPFVWGAVSKCVAITATYPLQVLRARQQVANSPYGSKNFFQIASLMLRNEGLQSLFGGYAVHLQRACLQNGIMFLIFEHFVHSMEQKRDSEES